MSRISSLTTGYQAGMLSVYPETLDDFDSLYFAVNNLEVELRQTLSFTGNKIIIDDTSKFPDTGLVKLSHKDGIKEIYEIIYYSKKTDKTLEGLVRGFVGSRQGVWEAKKSLVALSVFAEHQMAVRDAVINLQNYVGLKEDPADSSLNGILKRLESRFLAPKPVFRAFPIKGPPPMTVRFQNFSVDNIVRFLWDFGDGGTSLERSPIHTYVAEGVYTVKLNVVSSTGAQGVATKLGYIIVDSDESQPYFYIDSIDEPYSVQYAEENAVAAKEFVFVDQSDGEIVQRNWVFGDGVTVTVEDPDIHTISHVYEKPGSYTVTELILYSNGRLKPVTLSEPIVVL